MLDRRDEFDELILMYGTNNPDNVLFKYELLSFFDRNDIKYFYSVDRDQEGIWKQYVGVVTGLFDRATLSPEDTYAVLCGPPIMYRFVVEKLLKLGFPKEQYLHVPGEDDEVRRRQVRPLRHRREILLHDGPVFNYTEIEHIKEAI